MTDMTDPLGEWLNSLQSGVTDEVWTAAGPRPVTPVASVPQFPDRREAPPSSISMVQSAFTPDQPLRWYYGEPHDVPVAEWLIAPSSDAVSPDTSQPYFLDLIGRIDELT